MYAAAFRKRSREYGAEEVMYAAMSAGGVMDTARLLEIALVQTTYLQLDSKSL